MHLKNAIFINRVPFERLELIFNENEIAVLSSINGMGKTAILSHIADALYELAKMYYADITENKINYYRVSSSLYNTDAAKPSFVYFRFQASEGTLIDYVDIRNNCSEEEYNAAISLQNKIDFNSSLKSALEKAQNVKKASANFTKEVAEEFFEKNLAMYFPSYRFETPGYLKDSKTVHLDFSSQMHLAGNLNKPIEVVSGLDNLVNWIMDIVLDIRCGESSAPALKSCLDSIVSQALQSKNLGPVRIGIGPRNFGSTRLQIVRDDPANTPIYNCIFNLSSGELAIICLFGEMLRHSDITADNKLNTVSGIVLIDEVDKHLHIKLQKEVLPLLFMLFPNVQFILSSHSPFLSMGLAELTRERTKTISLTSGLSIQPTFDSQYQEVYEMMIHENERYKNMYDSLQSQIELTKSLQIVSEGKNVDHIELAMQYLAPELLEQVQLIRGVEGKSGEQQLKNAFEIMSKGHHAGKFLFVWDCDSQNKVDTINETACFFKFCFGLNDQNAIAKKGIENLYPENFFAAEVYDVNQIQIDYGGLSTTKTFNKAKFLQNIKENNDKDRFEKFIPLVEKIKSILDSHL